MICPNCGQAFEGDRCPNCGRPVAASPARVGALALWVSAVVPLAMMGGCLALGAGAVLAIFVPLASVGRWVLAGFGLWILWAAVSSALSLRGRR